MERVSNSRYRGTVFFYLTRIKHAPCLFQCNIIMPETFKGWMQCSRCKNKCNAYYMWSRIGETKIQLNGHIGVSLYVK